MNTEIKSPLWSIISGNESSKVPVAPAWVYSLISLYTSAIFLLAVTMNAMVVYASYKKPVLRKPINYIIINLAVADFLCGLLTGILIVPSNMAGYYIWSQNICVMEAYLFAAFGIVGLVSICIMAVERSIVICKPYGISRLTIKQAMYGIVTSWVWSILWNLPPKFYKDGLGVSGIGTACTPNWHSKNKWAGTYIPLYFVFCFAIPLLLIIVCYWKIIHSIKKVSKESTVSRKTKRERKIMKMVFVMISAFIFAWLPYAIVSLYVIANPDIEIYGVYTSIPSYFAKSSTIYNPLIYVGLNKQFRRIVKQMFCCSGNSDFTTSMISSTSKVNDRTRLPVQERSSHTTNL